MKTDIRNLVICAAFVIAGCGSDGITITPPDSGETDACGSCGPDEMCCNAKCVNVKSNAAHCGSCTVVCDPGLSCVNGECGGVCKCDDGSPCDANGSCKAACTPKQCESIVSACGSLDDGCGGTLNCGTCTGDLECVNNQCTNSTTCTPKSCALLDNACGSLDDGCGGKIECGACAGSLICASNQCIDPATCTPKTCAEIGSECGEAEDGCGNKIDCGTCPDDGICEAGQCKTPVVCDPVSCADVGANCGEIDTCAGKTDCGTCDGDKICQNNQCIDKPVTCTPKTCAEVGKSCGDADDGCGGKLNCGSCASNQTCTNGTCVNNCTPTSCAAQGKNCGSIGDGCGGTLNCGSCGSNQKCESNVCKASVKDTYPTRKSIKGLQPDFQDINTIIGSAVHGVAMNMVWYGAQDAQTSNCSGDLLYDGYCFTVDPTTEATIKAYSDAGVVVTAIVYGVPAWARISNCTLPANRGEFCAPADGKEVDYGRFAGFLANYFNGEKGHGRIADFVIHNEVNNYQWFNTGHNKLNSTNLKVQADRYVKSFNAAYDYIRKEQKNAKVLISLDHFWGKNDTTNGSFASRDFLELVLPQLGEREWRIAYHSYPPNLLVPEFGPNDYAEKKERVTFGTIGVLAGWLRQKYPTRPHAWEIQLTENGINGYPDKYQDAQKSYLCQAYKNVLGTPGIESFIYHRLMDHSVEMASGLGCGLWTESRGHKKAWDLYQSVNQSGHLACGFEYLPYIEMMRGYNSSTGMHYITTRQFPSGFHKEQSWRILREPAANTILVYECRVGGAGGNHTMISTDPNCENQFNMGPMGYLYTTQVSGSVPVYRCYISSGSHLVSSESNCEGGTMEAGGKPIGYAFR